MMTKPVRPQKSLKFSFLEIQDDENIPIKEA